MKNSYAQTGVLALLAIPLLMGCAFSRTEMKVNYAFAGQAAGAGFRNASLAVGRFDDRRGETDPRFLVHKRNQYGTTSGGYLAEKPVAEIVAEGVRQALERAGYAVNEGNLELGGAIESFRSDAEMGFWTGTLKTELAIKFVLRDKSKGRSLWNETFTGRGRAEAAFGGTDTVRQVFVQALDDALSQLAASDAFHQAMQRPPE
jgi:hypothetical protein